MKSKYKFNKLLLIDGWEEEQLRKHLKSQVQRKDIKIVGQHRGISFLQCQKQYEGYLPDDKF